MAAISGRPRHGKNPTKTWRGTGGANRDGVGAVRPDWARRRLLVVRLIAQHELTVAEIMKVADVSRQTVFTYRDKVVAGGGPACCSGQGAGEPSGGAWGCANGVFGGGWPTDSSTKDAQSGSVAHPQNTQREWRPQGATPIGRETEGTPQKPRKKRSRQSSGRLNGPAEELELLAAPAAEPANRYDCGCSTNNAVACCRSSAEFSQRGIRVHAPYATRYQWGYLHEAVEVDGANQMELFFTPCIDQDVHTLFLKQLGDTDPAALHVVIQDQAGFHLPENDPRLPHNVRLLPLPPYSPELNPVEKLGDIVKDRPAIGSIRACVDLKITCSPHCGLGALESTRVAELIGNGWLLDGVNAGAPI